MPDISSQPNIENFVCRPNTYLRYNIYNQEITKTCYESRHQCSSIIGVHPDCHCRYLRVTQIQQGCCILAGTFLFIAILVSYLKLIAAPENSLFLFSYKSEFILLYLGSARLFLTFAPIVLLSLVLLLMVITMILVGAYLRRNEYEDYDIKLPKQIRYSLRTKPETVNLYRLNALFKNHQGINFFYQLRDT